MKKNRKYNFIDLFAGCGGLSEGFLQTEKYEAIAHVEWEKPMVNTLRNRLVKKWGHSESEAVKRVVLFDVQKTDELVNGKWSEETKKQYAEHNHELIINKGLKGLIGNQKVDVIIGGPPCQAYSIHGRATDPNSMQNDYRNNLFESFVKIVEAFTPDVFVFENVPGILSARPGGTHVTDRIYKSFEDAGYDICKPSDLKKAIFCTVDFQVPQIRNRVLIIGVRKGTNLHLEDFYESITAHKNKLSVKTVRDAIGDLPKIYPLKESIKVNGKNLSHKVLNPSFSVTQHEPRFNNERDINTFKLWIKNEMNYVSHKTQTEFYHQVTGKRTLYTKYKNLEWDKPSHTVVAHLYKDGLMFIHPDIEQARSITVREAALLMSFPLDFEFIGSMAYCFKMIGNAVPVKFASGIADSIYDVLNERK